MKFLRQSVKIPGQAGAATFQDARQRQRHRRRSVIALALAATVALVGVLALPTSR